VASGVVRVLRKSEIAINGRNSPTAPITVTARPNGVSVSLASRRIGIRVPSAVELSAMAITTIPSPGARKKPIAIPSTTLMLQPIEARTSGRPETARKSISDPAMKKSIASPKSLSFSRMGVGSTQPSTAGPARIPSTSSNTMIGTRMTGRMPRASSGAATASSGISTSPRSPASTLPE